MLKKKCETFTKLTPSRGPTISFYCWYQLRLCYQEIRLSCSTLSLVSSHIAQRYGQEEQQKHNNNIKNHNWMKCNLMLAYIFYILLAFLILRSRISGNGWCFFHQMIDVGSGKIHQHQDSWQQTLWKRFPQETCTTPYTQTKSIQSLLISIDSSHHHTTPQSRSKRESSGTFQQYQIDFLALGVYWSTSFVNPKLFQ